MAGDTWTWTKSPANYPASDGWALSYVFTGPASFGISGSQVVGSGPTFTITVSAAITAAYTPGDYTWVAFATLASERHQFDSGVCAVQPNLTTSSGDTRSHAVLALAAIEAELLNRMTGAASGGGGSIESYQIANRAVHKIPTKELKELREMYRAEVWREKHPGKLAPSVGTRFLRAPA